MVLTRGGSERTVVLHSIVLWKTDFFFFNLSNENKRMNSKKKDCIRLMVTVYLEWVLWITEDGCVHRGVMSVEGV